MRTCVHATLAIIVQCCHAVDAWHPHLIHLSKLPVPQFVSGDHLVAFDPHAHFLPGISPAQPGLKIAFSKGNLPEQFPDAFAPFTSLAFAPFNCTLREHYKHTLFRFPLRCAPYQILNILLSAS